MSFPGGKYAGLGLIDTDHFGLKYLCCQFAAYHALKAKVRSGTIFPPGPSGIITTNICAGASLRRCWSVYTGTYQAEAGELALPHRRFSLPQFIDFLTNQNHQPDYDAQNVYASGEGVYLSENPAGGSLHSPSYSDPT